MFQQSVEKENKLDSKTELSKEDFELIEVAKETADRLHVDDVHEVAAALRTKDKAVFNGIHFETDVDWANVCGEVAGVKYQNPVAKLQSALS